MLNDITRYLDNRGNINIRTPYFDKYLDDIDIKINEYMNRTYKADLSIQTSGIDYIFNILIRCDLDTLINLPSMSRRVMYISEYILPMFKSSISGIDATGYTREDMFIDSGDDTTVEQVMITSELPNDISSVLNLYKNTPVPDRSRIEEDVKIRAGESNFENVIFTSSDKRDGYNARPLQLLYHDSKEATLDITSHKLRFLSDTPTMALYNLDIFRLCINACHYADKHTYTEDINWYTFIYQYCILPLYLDVMDIWLMNITGDIIEYVGMNDAVKEDKFPIKDYTKIPAPNRFIFTEVNRLIKDIFSIAIRIKNGDIEPSVLISSIKLYRHKNIQNYISYMLDELTIIDIINTKWMIYLRERYVLGIILNAYNLVPDNARSQSHDLEFTLSRMIKTRFWNSCKIRGMKQYIEIDVKALHTYIQSNMI